jgi:hypothetical protein
MPNFFIRARRVVRFMPMRAAAKGESVSSLIKNPPPGAPVPPIMPPVDGYLLLDKAKFPASFACDVNPEQAAFMADSQVPWGIKALEGTISEPAWKAKPSWYLLTTEDTMIPPDAQRLMSKRAGATVVEVKGSHAVYVSQPQAVASLIEKAATAPLQRSGCLRFRYEKSRDRLTKRLGFCSVSKSQSAHTAGPASRQS